MAAQISQVVLHPAISSALKVGGTTVGRDKLYRTIQYFARFLAFCELLYCDPTVYRGAQADVVLCFGRFRSFTRLSCRALKTACAKDTRMKLLHDSALSSQPWACPANVGSSLHRRGSELVPGVDRAEITDNLPSTGH